MRYIKYLILNSSGEGRVVTRRPSYLKLNEKAWKLIVHVPEGWARISDEQLEVSMPDPIELPEVVEH